MAEHPLNRLTIAALAAFVLLLAGCGGSSGGGGGDTRFDFRSDVPSAYARVDRMGQPATGSALLSREPGTAPEPTPSVPTNDFDNQRDAFNRGAPATDVADFLGIMAGSLQRIHVELGPVLDGLGLTRCSTGTGANTDIGLATDTTATCVAQAAPVVLPDVLTLDLTLPTPDVWPNGRGFDDNVINRLLNAALLDLRIHPITFLEELPLNPATNDADRDAPDSPEVFPYIRAPHPPPEMPLA